MKKDYTCRFHSTDWWHEEGCPHTTNQPEGWEARYIAPTVVEWKSIIELAHAYQEIYQPAQDESWGEGYWRAIEYIESCLYKMLAAERIALRDTIDRLPTENPERESDEYDRGMKDFKEKVLGLLG